MKHFETLPQIPLQLSGLLKFMKERKEQNDGLDILYFGQQKYERHPSVPYIKKQHSYDSIPKQKNRNQKYCSVGSLCCNCSKPGCSVRKCSNPRDNECVERNNHQSKAARRLMPSSNNFSKITSLNLESEETNEAFITTHLFDSPVSSDASLHNSEQSTDIHFDMKYDDDVMMMKVNRKNTFFDVRRAPSHTFSLID